MNLLEAAKSGYLYTVKELLEEGLDPDSKDLHGRTPLLFAAENGHQEVVGQLLSEAGVDLKDNNGRTPLSFAAENGHQEFVGLLLSEAGVDPNSKDKDGRTPLWWAAMRKHAAVVGLLTTRDSITLHIL